MASDNKDIDNVRLSPFVHFDERLCNGCYNSVKICPTRAIRMRGRKPVIFDEHCIGCGECIRVCSSGALRAVTVGTPKLEDDHISVALVSPVLYSQFSDVSPRQVLYAMRQMGFQHAADMSYFLEMFQCAADEFIIRNRANQTAPWPLISPVCPVVIRLIAFQFPSLLPHILPIMRPVALMAREVIHQIIRRYGVTKEAVTLYYINPCPTKMTPEKLTFHHEQPCIDKVLGINDVYSELVGRLEKIRKDDTLVLPHDPFEYGVKSDSLIWGISGGEIMGMRTDKTLAVSGLKDTIRYLEKIEMGLFQDLEYIEFRTCPEGCVGGTLTGIGKYLSKNIIQKTILNVGYHKRVCDDETICLYEEGSFQAKSSLAKLLQRFGARKEAMTIRELVAIEKLLQKIKGTDCAACGSPDCKTFAEDVVRGKAFESDCILLKIRGECETEH